jgi:hypothetical protein
MNRVHCIGIDPGVSGGVAVLYEGGRVELLKLAGFTLAELADRLRTIDHEHRDGMPDWAPVRVVLEEPSGWGPQNGAKGIQVLFRSVGQLEGVLATLRVRTEKVLPAKWQKPMGVIAKKGTPPTEKKRRHKDLAQQLFPQLKVTNWSADALLIAEWGRRQGAA